MNKVSHRALLLAAFCKTGDHEYLRAAECLTLPLLDRLAELRRRGRGRTVGRRAYSRFLRMHQAIVAGETVHAAACQEVAQHGRGPNANEGAAVDYLRHRYSREYVEAVEAVVADLRALERQSAEVARVAFTITDGAELEKYSDEE
jgi:hypothetical protein